MPYKLGRNAPKEHKNTLRLEKYLLKAPTLPVPPTSANWGSNIDNWQMLKNDEVGCCVFSAAGHMEMCWTDEEGDEFLPTEDQIIEAYSAVTGYIPGDKSTDNGTSMTDAYDYWQKIGVAGHKIDGWVGIDWNNLSHVQLAIYLFGAVNPGVNLPQSAMDQFNAGAPWSLVEGSPIIGGHSIPILAYGPQGGTCVTWAKRQSMSWEFFKKQTEELYAPISLDWVDKQGIAPNHIDLETLREDLAAIKS